MKTRFELPYRIAIIEPKKLIGFSITTSFQDDKTQIVWRKFMMRRNEIVNQTSNQLFSLQIYPENFTANQTFRKYALAEVSDFNNIPNDFETFELESGKYLVFNYQGKANTDQKFSDIYSKISFQKINLKLIIVHILRFLERIIIRMMILRKKRFGFRLDKILYQVISNRIHYFLIFSMRLAFPFKYF